jgi:hypothetical protein
MRPLLAKSQFNSSRVLAHRSVFVRKVALFASMKAKRVEIRATGHWLMWQCGLRPGRSSQITNTP